MDEVDRSGSNYIGCAGLTIYDVPEDFMEHESKSIVDVSNDGTSCCVDMAFNEAGMNEFFDRVMTLSKDNSIVGFDIPHSNATKDGCRESEDCVAMVKLQFSPN